MDILVESQKVRQYLTEISVDAYRDDFGDQPSTLDRVQMKCRPSGKDFRSMSITLICIPAKHFWLKVAINVLIIRLRDLRWLGENIIGIYKADVVAINYFAREQEIDK